MKNKNGFVFYAQIIVNAFIAILVGAFVALVFRALIKYIES